MRASVLLLLSAAVFSVGLAHPTTFQCSRYCKEDWSKFGYEVGSSYRYNYNGIVKTTVNATTKDGANAQSRLQFTSQVQISVHSACDYVMQLSNVNLEETYINKDVIVAHSPEKNEQLKTALTRHPLYFSFQNGRIETVCPNAEDHDILHIKKAILSAFQNSMPSLEEDAIVYETDISGNCETQYQIEDSVSNLVIKKIKNLEACSHRKSRHLSWLSVPHFKSSDKKPTSLLRSVQTCKQTFNDELILESTNCFESHLFQPFSNGDNGAATYLVQTLEFVSKTNTVPVFELPKNFWHETLLYNYNNQEQNRSKDILPIKDLLDKLERKTTDGVDPDVPKLFSQLVHELQNLDHSSMFSVFESVKKSARKKKFLLDAMPLITTVDGINTVKLLYDQGEITDSQMNSWLSSLIFLNDVSLPIIKAIKPLMELSKIKQKAILSGSALVYMYCKEDSRCLDKIDIQEVVDIIQGPLISSCIPSSPENHNDILLALKGVGNLGIANSLEYLRNCYSNNDSPMELRLAAIAAHRRINCAENENLEQFEDYFANIRQSTEIRIASYLAAMQCASYATFARVKDVLRNEETNQVGSFVWTHLTNLQESSSQWKHNLKSLVENEFLRNKFSTDMRKYSRNYEVSTFFDSLNTGATAESNVVFTSESYLPKSAMLNFTLDLFGEAVNVFEIGARIEGFEQVVENLFGPEGYFPEESIRNVLEKVRNNENESRDKIQELRNSFTSQTTYKEPTGLLYAKIFGNEISYTNFKDLDGLVGGPINSRSIVDALMKIFIQQDIDYTKSFVFLDSSYKVPTVLGFPLDLAINGTATVGLTVKGKMDLKDLWAHKLAIEGKIYPSATVEVVGTMTVDSIASKIGLKSVNTLHSNTYLDGHAFINKGKLVDLKLNVPKEQMNIINVESQVFLLHSDRAYPMDDVTDNVEDWQGCTQKMFSTVTGLELCYGMRYVNASVTPYAPYFPLTGKFKYSMDVKKTDTFDSYQLSLKTHTEVRNYRPIYSMLLYFDTPHSTVDRKIKTSYLLDCEKLSLNATLVSPFVNLEINSRIGDDYDNLGFVLQTRLNNKDVLLANMSLKSEKIDNSWKYEPLAELKYKNKQVVALSGNVNYLQGSKYSANLKFEGIANEPVLVAGDLHLGPKKFQLTASIKSKDINGNARATVVKRPESISINAKTIYDFKNLKHQVLDFEFNQHTIMRGTVSEESLYVSVNSTQMPLYNTLLSVTVQRDKLYFETKGLLTLFEETWETHQLLKFLRSNGNTDVALKCSLKCLQKNVDYNIILAHVKSETAFKIHGLIQLNKSQRLEALVDYMGESNRTLNILLYYPKQAWIINGAFNKKTEKEFYVLIESFYELNDFRRPFLVISGEYVNSTIAHFQNYTVMGTLEIPESDGAFDTPWFISSSLQISPDLFLNTAQLRTKHDMYISHVTWTYNSFSGFLQVNDKQLFAINGMKSPEELSMLLGFNIYQHFEISAKLVMPYRKFELLLYWDKDRDMNQKFALYIDRHVKKGLYLVDLEYPHQRVSASFILLPTQVTMNVTWGIDSTQRIYLKAGNKVYDIGGIWFAKLETPFVYLENQEFKLSYYILPQNAELKLDVSWRDQKITLLISGIKSAFHISGNLDVNTTIPEISKISVAVSHSHNTTDDLLKIKNDAVFIFNEHQIMGQSIWQSRGTNISSSFEIVSSSNMITPITGSLYISNNQSTNYFSGFVSWRNQRISVDYKFENSQSYIKIKTPFKGLEVTELDYTLIGEPDRLVLEVRINLLTQLNYALLSWNNEDYASTVKFEITCPIIGTYKIMFKHSTIFGHLEEYLVITQGLKNDIVAVKLHGDLMPILLMDITASIKFLEHKASLAIKNSLQPIKSVVKAHWNENYITSVLTIVFEKQEISDMRWDATSTLLNEDISCRYLRDNTSYIVAIKLPKGYKLDNVLTLENSYKIVTNVLNVQTPTRSGSLRYSHSLALDDCSFDHQLVLKMNNSESKFALSYNVNKDISFIDTAFMKFVTPWHYPITLNFSMPQENQNIWKPSFHLEYDDEKMLSIESLVKVQYLGSDIHVSFNLPYTVPFKVYAKYDFSKPTKIINVVVTEEDAFLDMLCEFQLENFHGSLSLNVTATSLEERDEFVIGSLGYDVRNPLKVVNFKISFPEQEHQLQFEASTVSDKNVRKANVMLLSTISNWEKAFIDLSVGLTHDESYITVGKNDKNLTITYNFDKLENDGVVMCNGKLILTSDFEMIKKSSLELLYKGNEKFQDVALEFYVGKHKSSFKGNYQLTNETNKGVQLMSLDSMLDVKYYQMEHKPINLFDVEARMKGSAEIKKLAGKINAAFSSNIPKLETVNVEAQYELLKKGHGVRAAFTHNQDYYSIQHNLSFLSNKYEVSVDFNTPPALYGKVFGKLISIKDNNSVETELFFERNSKLYNISMSTKYDSLLSSDTVIKVITPDKKYKGGIKSNITLTETNVKLYAIIDNDVNQVELLMKAKSYKKSEIHVFVNLATLNFAPWTIKAKYDFSSTKRLLSVQLNDNRGAGLEVVLDKQKLHVNVDTPTTKNFVVIVGSHKLNDMRDLSISYAMYFNDQKIKVDLANKVDEGRTTSLDISTTYKEWNRIAFVNAVYDDKFEVLVDLKGYTIVLAANKNALFNNQELLSIEFNKAPLITIWSGNDKSYLTSLSPWGNYKFLVNYQTAPRMYAFTIFQDGRKIIHLIIDNIHTEEYFDFTARMITPLFPKYSNLTAYIYTDYEIPNEFRFTLHNGPETLLALSYNFQLKEENYLAVFNFNSHLQALQAFSVSFNLNPQFLLEFQLSKTQFDVTKLYQLTIALPFHSDETQLEIGFPWQDAYCYVSLFMKRNQIDFYVKTPLKDWQEAALKANLNKLHDSINGEIELQKNSAHAAAEWLIGYDRNAPMVNIDIKNSLAWRNGKSDKMIINGKYIPWKKIQIFCDIDEFGNQINLDYLVQLSGARLTTHMVLPDLLLQKLNSNITIIRSEKADINLEINDHNILNFTASQGSLSGQTLFAKAYLNIYESLYYYNVNLDCDYKNSSEPIVFGSLNSKTYNYLLDMKLKSQIHYNLLNGNISATIVKGWDLKTDNDKNDYEIAWLLKREQQDRTARISYQQNDYLTYVDFHHMYMSNKLKSNLVIACGGRALNLQLEGNSSPEHSSATIALTTPLKELNHLKFETSLARANSTIKFRNILSWPDQQDLILNLNTYQETNGMTIDLVFSSPFNEPLLAGLNYSLNDGEFKFDSTCSMGNDRITLKGNVIPKTYLTTSFTSPFEGYRSLNLTALLDVPSRAAKIHFEKETLQAEFAGTIKTGENNIYLINMAANNEGSPNQSFATISLKVDTTKMNGMAEILWKGADVQIAVSYDPRNLLLEMDSPFEAAQKLRLQGQYFSDVNAHNLRANGVWNKAVIGFQGSLLADNKNLTIDSQINIGENYNGALKFHSGTINNNRAIDFNAHFPRKESEVNFKFVSEKQKRDTKAHISLSTPFEVMNSLSAETVTDKGQIEASLKANLLEEEVKANFKSTFKSPTQVGAILIIEVPQIDSKWEIETEINIYERGVLKIAYETPADSNSLKLDYQIIDSVLVSHFNINGTKANVSHALSLYFRNQYNHREYGLMFDEYKFRFKYTSRFYYLMEGFLQVNVPYFDIKSDSWLMVNLLENKGKAKCGYNKYDVELEVEKGYSVINASAAFNLGKYNSGYVYTEVELLKNGFFLKNKVVDVDGLWLNSTITYMNNRQALILQSWTKHSLLQEFTTDVHISSSLDEIYIDIKDIFKLDMEYSPDLLKVHVHKNVYNLKIDFRNSNFSFHMNSPIFEPEKLELVLGWSTKDKGRQLDFRYSELNNSVLSGSVNFNYVQQSEDSKEYLLTTNAYGYDKMVLDFSGKILITNVTQGFASLEILNKKSHAYFLLSPNDPYMAGLTIGSPFLPYEGFTLETGTSVNSTSIFIFAGTGPSDLLEKGFIHLESHEKYMLFEARREDKKIFIKYEAPAVSWLRLVDLQAELDVQDNTIKFFENFEVKSDITDNFSLNSKFNVFQSGLESEIHIQVPFLLPLPKFNAELHVPFSFSDDFNPRILIELPTTIYSAQVAYKHHYNQFTVSAGCQYHESKCNANIQFTNNQLPAPPTIFAQLNLPYGKHKHFEFSLKRQKDINNEHEVVSHLEAFNTRSELNCALIYKRDRQLFRILLTTPFRSYEKFSLNLEYQHDPERKIKALIFYPSLPHECGFDFGLAYRNIKEFKLNAKVALPVETSGFGYGEFIVMHNLNLKGKNKSHAFSYYSKINNFNASFDINTAVGSNFVYFNLDTKIDKNRFFTNVKSIGNIFDNMDFMFELETPLKVVQNLKLFLISSVNLQQGIHTGVAFNSKTLLQLDFIVQKGGAFLRFDNIWQPFLVNYEYSYTDDLRATGKICWDLNYPDISQIGGHLIIGKNFSVGLILPTRTMNAEGKYFIDKHNEYYFARISWYQDKQASVTLSFTNNTSNDIIYLRSAAIVALPFRTFEIFEEAEANFQESFGVKSTFAFKWDQNDNSKISLQNYILPGKLESRLFIPVLEHDIVLKLDISSLTKIPSHMKAQLEYSKDVDKRMEFEMYYDKAFTDTFRTERRFVLKHPASKIDYSLHFSTTRTPAFTVGNITLHYMNYFLNRHEQIRSSLKIGHEKLEVAGEIETSKNYLSIAGAARSGTYFQGFLATLQVNKKEPLIMEGIYNFKPTGSSLGFTASYGHSRKYDFYAGLPSKREITTKLIHQIYDTEIMDWLFTLKLNSSQILWMKLNWKNEFLTQFHGIILEEYNDLKFVFEGTGHQLIDVIEDDFGQELFSDVSELQKNISSYTKREIKSLSENYTKFVGDVKEGYQSNAFYVKDVERITKMLFPNLSVFETILLEPVWDFIELLYKGAVATIDDMFSSIRHICTVIHTQLENSVEEVKDIKKLKGRAKEILKNGINEARESLKQLDVLVARLMDSIDEYVTTMKEQCEEFFEPYLKLMDDFVIYVEQRLAILQMLVLDVLETVQHYILNLRESREVLKVYALYVNWLEELHVTDVLEPLGDVIEAILDTIITDIKKVVDDYRPYVDAISEAVLGNYQDLSKLSPVTEFREKFNHVYQRTLWIWNYHNLSEAIKNSIHKLIADFDDYLASLIKVDDTSNDFENVLGQSDYIFRPDIGLIEVTQPLPFEWEAFDEMPYFEQHPLYNKIKKRTENLMQLQRHHFAELLNTINSYIGESPKTLLSPPTNNIAVVVGKSHYITFDKKYYTFAGDCSYLLASDFITKTFSVVINYQMVNGTAKKKSISVISDENNLEISPDFIVALNDAEVDLPLIVGSLTVTREDSEVIVENSKGLKVVCNLYYDYCAVELSGWLFGKTGGLLGTLDNEKVTDMSLPDGDTTSDVLEFVQSWQVGISKCSDVNYASDATRTNVSPLSTTLFETLCQVFFVNANSPFGHCFSRVDPKPFYEMCVNNMKDIANPTMCSSAAAYKSQCAKSNIDIETPEMCVHCKHGIGLTEEIFDRDNPKSIDVVIIKENGCFGNNHEFSSLPTEINTALENKGFRDNQFAIVGYGGSISKPYVYTSGKQIWTTAENTAMRTKLNSSENSQYKISAVDAIKFAGNLDFRPGLSKLFILMQCDYYTEYQNLNSLHAMFGEKDITLHVLKAKSFNHSGELLELDSKGHVLYIQQGFQIEDFNSEPMNSTISQGVPDQITDIYSLLALSTNGSVLYREKETKTDQISASWAKIISYTAKRSPCQRCKCVTNPDGTGKVECARCMSPIVKQLLNEYESNIMEFHTDQDSEEYV